MNGVYEMQWETTEPQDKERSHCILGRLLVILMLQLSLSFMFLSGFSDKEQIYDQFPGPHLSTRFIIESVSKCYPNLSGVWYCHFLYAAVVFTLLEGFIELGRQKHSFHTYRRCNKQLKFFSYFYRIDSQFLLVYCV